MTNNSGNPLSAPGSLRAVDAARGLVISVIAAVIGYFVLVPAPDAAPRALSLSPNGLAMLLVGLVLQLALLFGRPLLARFERAHGLEGQVSPVALHVVQLLADGVTVLLFALAVFGGIFRLSDGI